MNNRQTTLIYKSLTGICVNTGALYTPECHGKNTCEPGYKRNEYTTFIVSLWASLKTANERI